SESKANEPAGLSRREWPRRSVRGDKEDRRDKPGGSLPAQRDISKWDIFYYVYGILHHPGYRTKFADNPKRQLPRIPFAPDIWAFATAGQELAQLHLDYEKLVPWPLTYVYAGEPAASARGCVATPNTR